MATAPEAATQNPISKAAKRPQKTQKFMDDLKQALDDFDDEVFSFASEQREVAYQILQRTTETHSSPSGPRRLMPV